MRVQTEQEFLIKQALAIYRGLPDGERAERMQIARTNRTHPDANVRAMADTLVRLFDQAEREIRADRETRTELERRVRLLESRTLVQPDIYGQSDTEIRRGAFGAGLIILGVSGVVFACYEFGVMTVIGGAVVVAVLRFLFSGSSGNSGTDYTPATGQAAQAQTQNIVVNVTMNGNATVVQ